MINIGVLLNKHLDKNIFFLNIQKINLIEIIKKYIKKKNNRIISHLVIIWVLKKNSLILRSFYDLDILRERNLFDF